MNQNTARNRSHELMPTLGDLEPVLIDFDTLNPEDDPEGAGRAGQPSEEPG